MAPLITNRKFCKFHLWHSQAAAKKINPLNPTKVKRNHGANPSPGLFDDMPVRFQG